MRGRRVLFLTGEYPPRTGGIGAYLWQLRRAFEADGVCTRVAVECADGFAPPDVTPLRPAPGIFVAEFVRAVSRFRPNVVHIQYQAGAFRAVGSVSVVPAALRVAGYRGRIAVTFHDLKLPYLFPRAGSVRRRAVDLLRRMSAPHVYVDERDAALERRRRPADADRILVIPAGPTIVPPADLPARIALRTALGIDADAFVVGFFGFRQASKGIHTLAASLRADTWRGQNVVLALIGQAAPEVANHRAEPAVAPAVFQGLNVRNSQWLSDAEVSRRIGACDVMALPFADGVSTRRTTFMVAAAHGVPVVTTFPPERDLPGISADDVLLVQPGDAGALAEALWRVRDSRELRRRLSEGSRRIAERFAWPRIAEQTLAAYDA